LKNDKDLKEIYTENPELRRAVKWKKARTKKTVRTLDRIFGFLLVTVFVIVVAGLAFVYSITKGPSESLRDDFVMTMQETRRFDFMSNLFLTSAEVEEIRSHKEADPIGEFDFSMVSISSASGENNETEDNNFPEDEDGDGVIFEEVKGGGYAGYLLTVLDPKRIIVGMPDTFGGVGLTLEEMVNKYDAIGGINAGGFRDEGGAGLGGRPEGLTMIDGVCYGETNGESMFVGFDDDGLMHVGYYNEWSANRDGIKNGVSFGPILIMNGELVNPDSLPSGVNPRTAIGQRSDGAILMLVIDGRQVHSMGATYQDCAELMLSRGVVNAINMDGGSSTSMYYNGQYVNKNSSTAGARPLPSAFLFK
jgi:exopolysaccharide biosynthesis protein